jgi:cell fate (sporulation/competence/biofilm development) regulator YlbF (YheA/YmcA/DUF963 family)
VLAQHFDEQMTADANLLGISVDEMKAGWAAGKNLNQIAQEKGITQDQLKAKKKAVRDEEMKQYLQTLVSQGKITQAQADTRLQTMQNRVQKAGGKMAGHGRGKAMSGKPVTTTTK